MKLTSIGIVVNPGNKEAISSVDYVSSIAANNGISCHIMSVSNPGTRHLAKLRETEVPSLIVVLGGDGTILRAVPAASEFSVPILGVNFGRIGFLSEIYLQDFETAIKKIADSEFVIEKRDMLCGRVNDGQTFNCLNDFLVYKASFSGIIEMRLIINGVDSGAVYCDGYIVSTPTGSTGYSLSSGGPVIAPGLEATIVTPICPHTLSARPVVATGDSKIEIIIENAGCLAADGEQIAQLNKGDSVHVTRSDKKTQFIRFYQKNLYSMIRERLS